MFRNFWFCLAVGLIGSDSVSADQKSQSQPALSSEEGTVTFRVIGDQLNVPERYRLEEHTFPYKMQPKCSYDNMKVDVYRVQFPSPFKSPHEENNTVHAEYYRPRGKGPFPCTIVLDITGGDQSLSRLISATLGQEQIAALFVQMAYYGPRRPQGSNLRFLSPDVAHTMNAVRQTVLDLRRASAWMEARPEVDPNRLAILGTSLGSFMAALAGEMEPRLRSVVVLLGGGGLVDAYYDNPQGKSLRRIWEALGGTKEKLAELIAPADPITCAANLKERRLLIIAGKQDEIVPPSASIALWKVTGEQKIVWYNCTHYGAALYFVPAMKHIVEHLKAK
jgi:dienelactone hydrolase